MPLAIPKTIPRRVYQGARLEFDLELSDYPTADWTVTLELDGPSPENVTIAPTEIAPATYRFSVDLNPPAPGIEVELGLYRYQVAAVSDGAEGTRIVRAGVIEVLASFLNGEGPDAADTFNRRMLAMIKAQMEGKIPRDSESYSINGRSISRIPTAELQALLVTYEARVEAELVALEHDVTPGRKRRVRVGFRS